MLCLCTKSFYPINAKYVQYLCLILFSFIFVIQRYKWASKNVTPVYNIPFVGKKDSTYDGSLCDLRPGTNCVAGAEFACNSR